MKPLPMLDFFAGSGLATEGTSPFFTAVWANDISAQKARVYQANHSRESFLLAPVEEVHGTEIPAAVLSWASFPCQDLSLAGKLAGLRAERSGLVWQWLRVTDEMPDAPPVLVAENVVGLLSAAGGAHYHALHAELEDRGYQVGPIVLDAVHWLPQSRPRVFIVASRRGLAAPELIDPSPNWMHPPTVLRAVRGLMDVTWWHLPLPEPRRTTLADMIDFTAPYDSSDAAARNVRLISPQHMKALQRLAKEGLRVAPGYKRTRAMGQVLELRFDGVAGCLRTPQGGSSRQHLVFPHRDRNGRNGRYDTRTLTVREAARLMGAPDTYEVPGSYNEGYAAMGDAVAVPVVRHLSQYLLYPLAKAAHERA